MTRALFPGGPEISPIKVGIDDGPMYELTDETQNAIVYLAMKHSISIEQVIAVSLMNENFLQSEVMDKGHKLLLKKGDTIRRLEYSE
jgi:hypothetical protein